ncbi:helix-turn-helix domain-containing protein [Jutongia sp.]|uniref:helix-turn-helix domain-containing protein n=1 Tax=Jutongia sp. TaxID=2944204 RepID=UPI0030806359
MELQEQKRTEQDILTQQELYEYLPLGRTTIQKLLQQKILPATKIGRNYLITKRKLLEWLDENAGNEFNID